MESAHRVFEGRPLTLYCTPIRTMLMLIGCSGRKAELALIDVIVRCGRVGTKRRIKAVTSTLHVVPLHPGKRGGSWKNGRAG